MTDGTETDAGMTKMKIEFNTYMKQVLVDHLTSKCPPKLLRNVAYDLDAVAILCQNCTNKLAVWFITQYCENGNGE